ncbi:MAG: hypothetical protein OEY67_07970 [Gammaproteobacteria bacterium]|nr:hypothetical protein [Gammaproteobacteria bacterium]
MSDEKTDEADKPKLPKLKGYQPSVGRNNRGYSPREIYIPGEGAIDPGNPPGHSGPDKKISGDNKEEE